MGERLAALSTRAIARAGGVFGAGVGLAAGAGFIRAQLQRHIVSPTSLTATAVMSPIIGAIAAVVAMGALIRVSDVAKAWSASRRRSRSRMVVGLALLGGVVGFVLWLVGAVLIRSAPQLLPAAVVGAFGLWAWLLTWRQAGDSERWLTRRAVDLLAGSLVGLFLFTLFPHDVVTTAPAAALLFPIGAWAALRTWRAMGRSRRLPVRVGADIVFSLLLGADLVLALVWLANLLDLPASEVSALRGGLATVGGLADLPWWLWLTLYLALAGLSLAFAAWPAPLAAARRWTRRLRLVESANVTKRVLTGVHIGLLLVVLIGASVPTALAAPLSAKVKAKYEVALRRELTAEADRTGYERIRQAFASLSVAPTARPLAVIVVKVHNVSVPAPGVRNATATEQSLARRLGAIQAAALRLPAVPAKPTTAPADAQLAGFATPVQDGAELGHRLDEADAVDERATAEHKTAERIAELAATAITSLLSIPNVGEDEAVQIVKEYLTGLVESGPVRSMFLAVAKRLVNAVTPPPTPERAVVPDPRAFELAAVAAWAHERANVRLADPFAPDQAERRVITEPPLDAAVDLANEARYFADRSGPCVDCPHVVPEDGPRGGVPHEGPGGERPVEPEIHVHVPIR